MPEVTDKPNPEEQAKVRWYHPKCGTSHAIADECPISDYPSVTRMGTVTISGGEVYVHDDWQFENCSCREAVRLALVSALGDLHKALADDIWRDRPSACLGTPSRLIGYSHAGCDSCDGSGWVREDDDKAVICPRSERAWSRPSSGWAVGAV